MKRKEKSSARQSSVSTCVTNFSASVHLADKLPGGVSRTAMAVSPLLHQSHEGKSFMDFTVPSHLVQFPTCHTPQNNSIENKEKLGDMATISKNCDIICDSGYTLEVDVTVYRRTFFMSCAHST